MARNMVWKRRGYLPAKPQLDLPKRRRVTEPPVRDEFRTARLPETPTVLARCGFGYRWTTISDSMPPMSASSVGRCRSTRSRKRVTCFRAGRKPRRYSLCICHPSILRGLYRLGSDPHAERVPPTLRHDRLGIFDGGRRMWRSLRLGQPQLDCCSLAGLAADQHGAAGLRSKALDHRQAEPGAAAYPWS